MALTPHSEAIGITLSCVESLMLEKTATGQNEGHFTQPVTAEGLHASSSLAVRALAPLYRQSITSPGSPIAVRVARRTSSLPTAQRSEHHPARRRPCKRPPRP